MGLQLLVVFVPLLLQLLFVLPFCICSSFLTPLAEYLISPGGPLVGSAGHLQSRRDGVSLFDETGCVEEPLSYARSLIKR